MLPSLRRLAARATGALIVTFARGLTAARAIWTEAGPSAGPAVYFANHTSNGDSILVWSVLPLAIRHRLRPVAAADYWQKPALRRFVGTEVFRSLLIERDPAQRTGDPVAQMAQALDEGAALILFPEGTRNTTGEALLPFKSGLYHLARTRPETDLVPVWIDNLNRVMPKGEIVPIPLICTVHFGAPLRIAEGEGKDAFLARARAAMLALRPAAREAA